MHILCEIDVASPRIASIIILFVAFCVFMIIYDYYCHFSTISALFVINILHFFLNCYLILNYYLFQLAQQRSFEGFWEGYGKYGVKTIWLDAAEPGKGKLQGTGGRKGRNTGRRGPIHIHLAVSSRGVRCRAFVSLLSLVCSGK